MQFHKDFAESVEMQLSEASNYDNYVKVQLE